MTLWTNSINAGPPLQYNKITDSIQLIDSSSILKSACMIGSVESDDGGRLVLLSSGNPQPFILSGIGLDIWHLLDGRTTLDEIVRSLAEEHKVDREIISNGVINFLRKLEKLALVVEQ